MAVCRFCRCLTPFFRSRRQTTLRRSYAYVTARGARHELSAPIRIEVVLGDIDGTFVDNEPAHNRALLDTLAAYGIHPSVEMQRRVVGNSIENTYALLAAEYADIPALDVFIAAKTTAYLALVGELRLRAGIETAEAALRTRSIRRAFVSNLDRIIVDANVLAAGVREPELITISRNDVRHGKPDPISTSEQNLSILESGVARRSSSLSV
jgi:phosphoglycolate phosphatase-like HAD superfamily hydrolase